MISYDSEAIPPKEDTTTTTMATTPATVTQPTVEVDCVQTTSSSTTGSTNSSSGADEAVPTTTTASSTNARFFNFQFQQRSKYIREMWSQRRARINKEFSQFFLVIFFCFFAILCTIGSLTTNYWTCDPNSGTCFGLWTSCFMAREEIIAPTTTFRPMVNSTNITIETTTMPFVSTEPINIMEKTRRGIKCVKQELSGIFFEFAEQSRIDQVAASQGLIISGIGIYIFSVVCFFLAYKFMKLNNLNYLRNALITCVFLQIIAFLLLLIGFFLFIYTDSLSLSVVLIFVYFAIAIFATNIINFITIEYKSFKMRQIIPN